MGLSKEIMETPLFENIKAGGGKETWIAVLGVSHQHGIDSWEVVLLAGVTTAGAAWSVRSASV